MGRGDERCGIETSARQYASDNVPIWRRVDRQNVIQHSGDDRDEPIII